MKLNHYNKKFFELNDFNDDKFNKIKNRVSELINVKLPKLLQKEDIVFFK